MGEEWIGTVKLFAMPYAPPNFAPCDGRVYRIGDNQSLFCLLGNQFGGDNQTFCLPDLRGKEPIPHTQYCICVEGLYPPRP